MQLPVSSAFPQLPRAVVHGATPQEFVTHAPAEGRVWFSVGLFPVWGRMHFPVGFFVGRFWFLSDNYQGVASVPQGRSKSLHEPGHLFSKAGRALRPASTASRAPPPLANLGHPWSR